MNETQEIVEINKVDYIIDFEHDKELSKEMYIAFNSNEIKLKTDKLWLINMYAFILSLDGILIINNIKN